MVRQFVRLSGRSIFCAGVVLLMAMAGCNAASGGGGGGGGAGDSGDLDDGGNDGSDNDGGNDGGNGGSTGTVSFAAQIQPIFTSKCVACHSDGGAFRDFSLRLTAGDAYDSLVNRASEMQPDMELVTPGDVDRSFLYEKITEQSPSEGLRMPMGGSPLPADEMALIETWIEQGAQDN